MTFSRRRLLLVTAAIPAAAVAARAASVASDTIRRAVRMARPAPVGTSATSCAQCGSPEHSMLDPRCPLAPRVLS